MLGQAIVPELRERGHDVYPFDRSNLDVLDVRAVAKAVGAAQPDVIVQCAAFTAVDAAESREAEAFRINAGGAEIVGRAAAGVGALFVYPSTDYVFSADVERPLWPDDPVLPLNAYGRSKLAGEQEARAVPRHLIVRTSWLYGAGGKNFVDTISRLAGERPYLEVVNDQIGVPTWTVSLSRTLAALVERGAQGVYHASDGGDAVSWYEFAREIVRLRGVSVEVRPVPTSAYPTAARRPRYSVLDCAATEELIGSKLPDWREMLKQYLA
jgi:dTDP-4-dehydrorhamnose reductase